MDSIPRVGEWDCDGVNQRDACSTYVTVYSIVTFFRTFAYNTLLYGVIKTIYDDIAIGSYMHAFFNDPIEIEGSLIS